MPATIRLDETTGKIRAWGNINGEKFDRPLLPRQLVKLVMQHAQAELFETPLPLPQGTIYFAQQRHTYRVAIIRPKTRVEYNLAGQIIPNVGMPNLLFVFTVQHERIVSTKLACLDSIKVNDHSKVYHYPLSNVYSHGGSVCWGSTILPNIKKGADLDMTVRMFLSIEKNYDLYSVNSNTKKWEYRQLISYLTGRDFDDSLLVESNKNLIQFLKGGFHQ